MFLAVGRRPNNDGLGLEKAGVLTDKDGYIQWTSSCGPTCQGSGPGGLQWPGRVYAYLVQRFRNCGGRPPRSGYPPSERPHYGLRLVYRPTTGRAGMTEMVGKRPMSKVSRAIEKGETSGFMNVIVDAETRRILRAAVLGTGGDEVIHSILDVMYAEAPYSLIQRAVHIHPTLSELIPTMLGELQPVGSGQ